MPDRGDFDSEWDNNAERILADMDFKDTDTEYETRALPFSCRVWDLHLLFMALNDELEVVEFRRASLVQSESYVQYEVEDVCRCMYSNI